MKLTTIVDELHKRTEDIVCVMRIADIRAVAATLGHPRPSLDRRNAPKRLTMS